LLFGWEGEEKVERLWDPFSLFCFIIFFMFFEKGGFFFVSFLVQIKCSGG
jgi:hypothetical protein